MLRYCIAEPIREVSSQRHGAATHRLRSDGLRRESGVYFLEVPKATMGPSSGLSRLPVILVSFTNPIVLILCV